MDLGRQRAHTSIRSLPIVGHKEAVFGQQGSDGSDGWVPILVRVDPGE